MRDDLIREKGEGSEAMLDKFCTLRKSIYFFLSMLPMMNKIAGSVNQRAWFLRKKIVRSLVCESAARLAGSMSGPSKIPLPEIKVSIVDTIKLAVANPYAPVSKKPVNIPGSLWESFIPLRSMKKMMRIARRIIFALARPVGVIDGPNISSDTLELVRALRAIAESPCVAMMAT